MAARRRFHHPPVGVIATYSLNQLNNQTNAAGVNDNNPYSLGLHYGNGPIFAAFDYITNDAGGKDQAYSFAAKYTYEPLGVSVGGMYEIDDGMISRAEGLGGASLGTNANAVKGADQWYAFATYGFGNALLYGSYGERDDSNAAGDDGQDAWSVALDYRLGKRTDTWLAYGSKDMSAASVPAANGTCGAFSSCDVVSVGMRHLF